MSQRTPMAAPPAAAPDAPRQMDVFKRMPVYTSTAGLVFDEALSAELTQVRSAAAARHAGSHRGCGVAQSTPGRQRYQLVACRAPGRCVVVVATCHCAEPAPSPGPFVPTSRARRTRRLCLQAKKKQMIDLPIPECSEVPDYETFTGRGYAPPPFYVRRRVRDEPPGPGAPAYPAPHIKEDEWLEYDVDADAEVRAGGP